MDISRKRSQKANTISCFFLDYKNLIKNFSITEIAIHLRVYANTLWCFFSSLDSRTGEN